LAGRRRAPAELPLTLPALAAGGLSMQPLAEADAPDLHELWTTAGVRRWLWDGRLVSLDETREIVETSRRMFADRRFGLWGVREAGPRLVGFAGFWYFRQPIELELLYGISEEAWGRGHATAAGRAVLRYGFGSLQMPVIRASTDGGNVASARVLGKLGFDLTRRATIGGLETCFYERPFFDDLDDLAARFAACTLPRPEWTHLAHLSVGAWHVNRYGKEEALVRLRDGIRVLNDSHGTINSATSGYHETITRAYVELLAQFLAACPVGMPIKTRTVRLILSPLAARDALFTFYSRERLMSEQARKEWLEPDVAPLRIDSTGV
jgi:RimJ/RimL family protein N-acetyltransferase